MIILQSGFAEIFHHSANWGIYKFFAAKYPKSVLFPGIIMFWSAHGAYAEKMSFAALNIGRIRVFSRNFYAYTLEPLVKYTL